jgi:hypothetical protein
MPALRAALELHVFHPQAQALEQAHPGAVEQRRDEPGGAGVHRHQQRAHLARREHHRHPARGFRGDDFVQPWQLHRQHLLVQEEQGRLGLALRGRRHPAFAGEVRQKGLDLGCAQLARMAQAVEVDEAPHPAHVGLFRAQRVVAHADRLAQRGQKPRRRLHRHRHIATRAGPAGHGTPAGTQRSKLVMFHPRIFRRRMTPRDPSKGGISQGSTEGKRP